MGEGCGVHKNAVAAAHSARLHVDDVETRTAPSEDDQPDTRAVHKQLEVTSRVAAARKRAERDCCVLGRNGVCVLTTRRCLVCFLEALVADSTPPCPRA